MKFFSFRHLSTAASALAVAACAQAPVGKDHEANVVADFSDGFDNRDAVAILRECEAPANVLWVEEDGEFRFVPTPDIDYETAACVLNKIKESGTTKFGFVGNEKYVTPDESE